MQYKKLSKLSEDKVELLKSISDQVTFKASDDVRRRMGVNGQSRLSKYEVAKWYQFGFKLRRQFKDAFDDANPKIRQALIGWFINFQPDTGFLDRIEMNKGMDKESGVCHTYAISGDLEIIISGEVVKVPKGSGVSFKLTTPHEVVESSAGGQWAAFMTMPGTL